MRSHRFGQGGVGAAALQSQGNVVNYRKGVKPMRTRFWIMLVALMMLLTATLTGDVVAQSTGRGYLRFSGDYDWWTLRVKPVHIYTVWMRADNYWVDFDLYVYDPYNNLVCSSTGPGPYEACTFLTWYSTYYAKVVSDGGCPHPLEELPEGPGRVGGDRRLCGEGSYTIGIF